MSGGSVLNQAIKRGVQSSGPSSPAHDHQGNTYAPAQNTAYNTLTDPDLLIFAPAQSKLDAPTNEGRDLSCGTLSYGHRRTPPKVSVTISKVPGQASFSVFGPHGSVLHIHSLGTRIALPYDSRFVSMQNKAVNR